MKFKFNDKALITNKFYRGVTGTIKEVECTNDWTNYYEYYVKFESYLKD